MSHAFESAFQKILKRQEQKERPSRRPIDELLGDVLALLDESGREMTILELAQHVGRGYDRVGYVLRKARHTGQVSWRRKRIGAGKGGSTVLFHAKRKP
jgi:hypothetical protein